MLGKLFSFFLFARSSDLNCDSIACPEERRGDGNCDLACMSPFCGFDMPEGSDQSDISYSDCAVDCTSVCADLSSGDCSSDCGSLVCGFALGRCGYCQTGCFASDLANSICEEPCNNSSCLYDLSICDECDWDCTNELLTNDLCDYECDTGFCNSDNNICNGYCAGNCLNKNIGDGECNPTCFIEDYCDNDLEDCECSPGCTLFMRNNEVCDPECNNSLCNYDENACGDCASDCFSSMINNGVCDSECYNIDCNYDVHDCTCPCDYNDCDSHCLNILCMFNDCFDSFKTEYSLGTQLINMNFNLNVDSTYCENNTECVYVPRRTDCDEDCNNEFCMQSNAECYKAPCYDDDRCDRCFGDSDGQCLRCYASYKQFYGYCVDDCPPFHSGVSFDFFPASVCVPDIDHTTEDSPKEYFVGDTVADIYAEIGSEDNPFPSLGDALAGIYTRYSIIYLSVSSLDLSPLSEASEFYRGIDFSDPLNRSNILIKKLKIRPIDDDDSRVDMYVRNNLSLKFYVSGTLEIERVNIIGKLYNSTCSDPVYCNYCAEISLSNGEYYTDKGKKVPEFLSDCSGFHDYVLFDVTHGSSLILNEVRFEDLRMDMKSLILSDGADVTLTEVDFTNVKINGNSANGVITYLSCSSDYCGRFSYLGGLVELLNNGYQFETTLGLRSFFFAQNLDDVIISNVEFSHNLAYAFSVDQEEHTNTNSLIEIKIVQTLTIENGCSFHHNYAHGGLININSASIFNFTVDSDLNIQELQYDHVIIRDSTFYKNSGMSYGILKIAYESDIHNILLEDLDFYSNFVENGSLIQIENDSLQLYQKNGGTIEVSFFDEYINGFAPRQTMVMKSLNFTGNYLTSFGLFNMLNMVNIEMLDLLIAHNVEANENIDSYFLNEFKSNEDVYLNYPSGSSTEIVAENLGIFYFCYNVSLNSSVIEQNSFITGNSGLMFEEQEDFMLSSSQFLSNSGNSTTVAGIFVVGEGTYYILNTTFKDNRSNGSGVAILYADFIKIQNTVFDSNDLSQSPCLFLSMYSAELRDVNFTNNKIKDSYGGIISGRISIQDEVTEISIVDSYYHKNTVTDGEGGLIYIYSEGGSNYLRLDIQNTIFDSNTGINSAGSLYISPNILIEESSIIESCQFINHRLSSTLVILQYSRGTLTFSNDIFQRIENEGTLFIPLIHVDFEQYAEIFMRNCTIEENSGEALIRFFSTDNQSNLNIIDCNFCNNKAPLMTIDYGRVIVSNSVFSSNTSKNGALIVMSNEAETNVENCQFLENSGFSGTVGFMKDTSIFSCHNCVFYKNKAQKYGGVFYANLDSLLNITSSEFSYNEAYEGSAIYMIECRWKDSILSNSSLYFNHARKAKTVSLMSSNLTIEDTWIYNNTDDYETPGVSALFSNVNIYNSVFEKQIGSSGVFLTLIENSNFYIYDSSFINANVLDDGQPILVVFGHIEIQNCTFHDIEVETKSVIEVSVSSTAKITNSDFYELYTSDTRGIVECYESECTITSCTFTDYLGIAVRGDFANIIQVTDSVFLKGASSEGTGVFCDTCEEVSIASSDFTELSAHYGGAIYLSTDIYNEISEVYTIDACSFTENQANISGGAICAVTVNLEITNSIFTNNTANSNSDTDESSGKGGALYLTTEESDNVQYSISSNDFYYNTAINTGGAVFWDSVEPVFAGNNYVNNSAFYAPDVGSFATKLMMVNEDGSLEPYSRRLEENTIAGSLLSVASGWANTNMTLAMVDHYDEIVKTDNLSTASILATSTDVGVSGETKVTALNGLFIFDDFTITALPGSTVAITIETTGISIGNKSANIEVNLRSCVPGEASIGITCMPCEPEYYSLDPSDSVCTTCPAGKAKCYGGINIVPLAKYWRSSINSTTIWECPNKNACLGGEIKDDGEYSLTGWCLKGYKGNMCQSCDKGYSRTYSNMCTECPAEVLNILRIIGMGLFLAIVLGIAVYTTLQTAYKPKDLYSVYLKIFINYVQLIMLLGAFRLNWPSVVKDFFAFYESTGEVTEQFVSVDCFFSTTGYDSKEIYYYKLVILALCPLLFSFVIFLVWGVISLYKRKMKYLREQMVSTIVILGFLLHPTITKRMFEALNCRAIEDGDYWLTEELDIKCLDETHIFYVVCVVLPSVIIWVVFFPAALLVYLSRKKRQLNKLNNKKKYGFVYNGYSLRCFYWEFVILYRKLLIIICLTFLYNVSIELQTLMLQIVLLLSFYIQTKFTPYNDRKLNNIEITALLVAIATVFCGLYYLTEDLTENWAIAFFALMLFFNLIFFIIWSLQTFRAFILFLSDHIAWIRRLCIKEVKDGFSDDIFGVQERDPHILIDGEEKLYTFVNTNPQVDEIPQKSIDPKTTMNDIYLKYLERSMEKHREQSVNESLVVEDIKSPTK